ncbi:protein of unknown function DUF330 [Gluconacetobacter diazotrophicus PA1 5]|nr:PqiC family protein [Gluconacetobacter diazotrophicus]ACI51104.1 protein of unknown function DUF330 [Gluconacetobacter diazotrophicus PA1 5]MBB2157020.1 membrane integrity-associated transporter subunit PqiC [Gluconacetobacter diazotrophicus]TWB07621.1 hypothetical protein FBZ86_11169 [Gluconacetobacter diazotrophicus]
MSLPGHAPKPAASRRGLLRGGLGLLTVAAAGPLGACSSDPAFYALAPWPGAAQGGAPMVIEVRTPNVAVSLDRDRIVRSDGDYRVRLADGAAWSESLPGMIAHVLTADLQQRLPGSTVFAQNDAVAAPAQAAVELTVTRFARDAAGQAVLGGSLAVHRVGTGGAGEGGAASSVLALALSPQGSDTGSLVAALSTLLGQVADQAAAQLRVLGPVPPPA